MQGVSKRFGVVQALADVSFECRPGEIHAVVGENGSGKSTLLGIASGVLSPDTGTVDIGGQRLTSATAGAAKSLGLGMAYQSLSEVAALTVAENLYLATPTQLRPKYGDRNAWATAILDQLSLRFPAAVLVGSLSFAQRQLLEVAKALQCQPKVLALDEPTTALGPDEVHRLHRGAVDLTQRGVGVIYVSHRLPEVLSVAHRVTVLRDGEWQGTFEATALTEHELVALMINRPLDRAFPDRTPPAASEAPLITVSSLAGDRFGPIDLEIGKGEIIGLAGAEGNGQAPFLRALAGANRSTGTVHCNGHDVNLNSPFGALKAGIVLLSADRRQSVFRVLGVRSNATLQVLRRFTRFGFLSRKDEKESVSEIARRLRIRTASIEQPVQFLSGGNQQKVALSRPFLRQGVTLIIAEEPTQGVDVRARFEIYEALTEKAREGVAVLIKSSDPIELTGMCDRVLVLSRGRIVEEIPAAELNERRNIVAMVGSKATARPSGS
jgi:ribose transport system ATP-binding protein